MYGGLGCGKFYLNEVDRIEIDHRGKLPKSGGYTDQEIQAGFKGLADKYGHYATLLYLEKETPFNRNQIIEMSVYEVYHNIRYIADYNAVTKKYFDIMNPNRR